MLGITLTGEGKKTKWKSTKPTSAFETRLWLSFSTQIITCCSHAKFPQVRDRCESLHQLLDNRTYLSWSSEFISILKLHSSVEWNVGNSFKCTYFFVFVYKLKETKIRTEIYKNGYGNCSCVMYDVLQKWPIFICTLLRVMHQSWCGNFLFYQRECLSGYSLINWIVLSF